MQRLRVKFARGEELKFISHLDIMRLWQRALHRADMPLVYSEGFSPHPKIALAMPLAVGVTSEAELMDIFFSRWVSPHFFATAISRQLPAGMNLLQAHPVAPSVPSLQSQLSHAEYSVRVETDKKQEEIESAISSLLSLEHLPWQHQRDTGTRQYDLRTLITDIWLIDCTHPYCIIGMRLRSDSQGSGRPEQVALALGFKERPLSIHRTRLLLETS